MSGNCKQYVVRVKSNTQVMRNFVPKIKVAPLCTCVACRSDLELESNTQAEAEVLLLQARLALLAQHHETAVLLAQVNRAGR
jgi:hypothetical protein